MKSNGYGIITASYSGQDVNRQQIKKENPIIVIPGVMGSRLFSSSSVFDESTRVWDPKPSIPGVWDLDNKLKGTLYVRPFENQNYDKKENAVEDVQKYGREYGAQDTYKTIVDKLCDKFPKRKVFFFSYNWMESNAESARKLNENICVLNEEKVDLVCHSMGGLVAAKYYKDYGKDQKVEKIITCATPYEGAPKLINSIVNWDILGKGVPDLALGLVGGIQKDLKASFIGVAELTPTKNYVSKIPMKKVYITYAKNYRHYKEIVQDLPYKEYVVQCETIFNNKDKVDRYKNIREFQASLLNDGYNVLLTYGNAYFAIGINQKTITSIVFKAFSSDVEQLLYESDLQYEVLGDGTVPYISSSIMEQIADEKLDKMRWTKIIADHTRIIKAKDTMNWVVDILKQGFSTDKKDVLDYHDYTVIRVACPVDVTVAYNGEQLTSKGGQTSMATSFGRMDRIGRNNEIKMLCLDTKDDYDIVLNGIDKGTMEYSIRFFDKTGILSNESNFTDIPITKNTIIHTGTNQKSDIVLHMDSDGNGVVNEIRYKTALKQLTEADILSKAVSTSLLAKPEECIGKNNKDGLSADQDYSAILSNRKRLLQRLVCAFVERRKSREKLCNKEDKK